MSFLVSQLLFLFAGLIGLIVWACADMPLAVREIAINSRKAGEGGSSYTMIKVLSICLKILAVAVWIMGVLSIVAYNAAGSMVAGLIQGQSGF